jgi:hypothetical protein
MFDRLFFRSLGGLNMHPGLKKFISDILSVPNWDYWSALKLTDKQVYPATQEMIMDNPEDVINGVNKVEVVLNQQFFGLFNTLLIKHHDSGSVMLVFYATVPNPALVLALFGELSELLGAGYHDRESSLSFHDQQQVEAFAAGKLGQSEVVVGHIWIQNGYAFNLSYRSNPQHQLVFTVTRTPEKVLDRAPRKKGTLINILTYAIDHILNLQELSAEPYHENGKLKYIDYTFALDPPELKLFDRVRIRIFDAEKRADKGQFHVTYFSRFEVNVVEAITFSDKLFKIYGSDSSGDKELAPYEIELIEAHRNWQGRSWWINRDHTVKDFDNDQDIILYWLYFVLTPDEDGFSLHVVGFNDMLDYHRKHFGEFSN